MGENHQKGQKSGLSRKGLGGAWMETRWQNADSCPKPTPNMKLWLGNEPGWRETSRLWRRSLSFLGVGQVMEQWICSGPHLELTFGYILHDLLQRSGQHSVFWASLFLSGKMIMEILLAINGFPRSLTMQADGYCVPSPYYPCLVHFSCLSLYPGPHHTLQPLITACSAAPRPQSFGQAIPPSDVTYPLSTKPNSDPNFSPETSKIPRT